MKNLLNNLFSKKQSIEVLIADGKENIVKTKSKKKSEVDLVIEQIHHEFDTAGDVLLKEANEIISSSNFCTEKADKLKSLGFKSVPEVKVVEDKIKAKKMSEQTVALIQEYRFKYPNNKFITTDMIESICKKYGLVYGDIDLFKGFVPLHNLNQISEFFKIYPPREIYTDRDGNIFDMTGFEIKKRVDGLRYYHFFKEDHYGHAFQSDDGINFYGHFEYNTGSSNMHYGIKKQGLKICAPLKDMDMTGKILDGFFIKEWPDPVVILPVNGGGIIITAWGDESTDELVIDHKNN